MKVVFLHTDFRLYWPARLKFLYESLLTSGHDLIVVEVTGKGSPYLFDRGSDVTKNSWWHCLFPEGKIEHVDLKLAHNATMKKLKELRADFVFAGSIAFVSGAAAVNWCRSNKKPLVIFDDVRLKDVPRSKFVNYIKKTVYSGADAVFIPSPSHDEDFKFWGFKQNEIFHGVNVVDNKLWQALIPSQSVLRSFKETNSLPNRFILGVGRQVQKKNWKALLHAFYEENQAQKLPFSLALVGNGPKRGELAKIAKENNDSNIKIFDFQEPEELAKFYALADAVILPSYVGESWGLVINEAMACGKPVLVSQQSGCCEALVKEGVTGFSFDANNNEEIKKTLRKIANLPLDELNKMGAMGKELISNWDLERFAQGVNEAIGTLTNKPAKGFRNPIDKTIIKLWKGRYRPT